MLIRWGPQGFRPVRSLAVKCAVVSFASGPYHPFGRRLRLLLGKQSPSLDVYVYTDESQIGSPSHRDNPYAFKVHAVETVRSLGYDIVFWCDSILQPTQPLESILPEVEAVGVYLAEDGWKTGMYANDKALEYFGVTRDQAMERSAVWACFMAFDFRKPTTREFFRRWKKACQDGIFAGKTFNNDGTESADPRCRGHRHDQSCAELIAYEMGIPLSRPVLHPDPNYGHRYFTGRQW